MRNQVTKKPGGYGDARKEYINAVKYDCFTGHILLVLMLFVGIVHLSFFAFANELASFATFLIASSVAISMFVYNKRYHSWEVLIILLSAGIGIYFCIEEKYLSMAISFLAASLMIFINTKLFMKICWKLHGEKKWLKVLEGAMSFLDKAEDSLRQTPPTRFKRFWRVNLRKNNKNKTAMERGNKMSSIQSFLQSKCFWVLFCTTMATFVVLGVYLITNIFFGIKILTSSTALFIGLLLMLGAFVACLVLRMKEI